LAKASPAKTETNKSMKVVRFFSAEDDTQKHWPYLQRQKVRKEEKQRQNKLQKSHL
jgi:hypothetical protein